MEAMEANAPLVAPLADGVSVLAPMTMALAMSIQQQGAAIISEQLLRGNKNLVCDLSKVQQVDSVALVILISWQRLIKKSAAHLQFRQPSSGLTSLATLYNVQQLLPGF